MKKVILTAALGCSMLTGAYAEKFVAATSSYSIEVVDNITMTPPGALNQGIIASFASAVQMTTGKAVPTPAQPFQVQATRSFHVNQYTSKFHRTGPDPKPTGVDDDIPSALIMQTSSTSADPKVTQTTGPNHLVPFYISTTENVIGVKLIQTNSGGTVNFDVQDNFVPGNVFGSGYNMSGVYGAVEVIIASLD